MAVHLVFVGDVLDGVLFSNQMPWMRSGTELSQFLRNLLPTVLQVGDRAWVVRLYGEIIPEL